MELENTMEINSFTKKKRKDTIKEKGGQPPYPFKQNKIKLHNQE